MGTRMDATLGLDEKTLKRISPLFFPFFLLLLGFPAIAQHFFTFDLENITNTLSHHDTVGFLIQAPSHNGVIPILLQCFAFSIATVTTLLALTQYQLTHNKIALIIGLSILFSGTIESLNSLFINPIASENNLNETRDMILWTTTNIISGFIFIAGFMLLLKNKNTPPRHAPTLILLLSLGLSACALIYSITSPNAPSEKLYHYVYLLTYLVIAFYLYPKAYKAYPNILTHCTFYIAITEIVIAVYLICLSDVPNNHAYETAYFLKIIAYFIPFSCLIINYIFSYHAILHIQNTLQNSQEKLTYLAAHDALTNLYNRREFEILLGKTIANYSRNYDSFALFLIDIDDFKSINDTLGHVHGDHFLKKFSEQLKELTRQGDILSRIGGDEFTVVMSKLKSASSARKLAERIITGLNIPYLVDEKLLTCTASIGIAIYPIDGTNTEELLKNADIAMYNAKKAGKFSYQFYTKTLSNGQHRESEIEFHLREAIKRNELTLVYQPQYHLITRDIIGAEILLRWQSDSLGMVSPDEFIPIAENNHLIEHLGHWVLSAACEQAKRWFDKYQCHLIFSINVSSVQLMNNNFYTHFKKTLDTMSYPAEYMNIEISENVLLKNNENINTMLENLHALGTNITIDDFGMGCSSLIQLKSRPIRTIKIDKSFIADIRTGTTKVVIIDTIIKLAHELGITVIAEGIETPEQLHYLTEKNCLFGQGFLLNKPLSAALFEIIAYNSEPERL